MSRKKTPKAEPKSDLATILPNMVDRRRGSVYDRLRFSAGNTSPEQITLFCNPVGPTRTFVDTNMVMAGWFPPPQDMIVERFLFLFQPTVSEQDRNIFLANYRWEFGILEKTYNREPLLRCSVVGKPEDLIPDFGLPRNKLEGEGSKLFALGTQVVWDLEKYANYLPPFVTFRVNLIGSPMQFSADFDLYVMIEGLRDYAIL